MRNHMKTNILASLILMFGSMIVLSSSVVFAQEMTLNSINLVLSNVENTPEIAWNPDGSLIALAADHDVWIYTNTLTPIPNGHLQGHTDNVMSIDWSPDGRYLASGSQDKTIRIWNLQSGEDFGITEAELGGYADWVSYVRWSPDGTKLASVAIDNSLEAIESSYYFTTWIWTINKANLQEIEVDKVLPSAVGSIGLTWSPDSQYLATGGRFLEGNDVRVWNVATGENLYGFNTPDFAYVTDLSWSHTGQFLVIGSEWWGGFRIVDTTQRTYTTRLLYENVASVLGWSPDDRYIAAGSTDGNITIWDAPTLTVLVDMPTAHNGIVSGIRWSADGTKLATVSSADNTLKIWNTATLSDLEGTATVTPIPMRVTPTSPSTPKSP